ncbi:MAG: hypothetical protein K2Z81_15655 [Cyanobacteria bacterium]|nr:hypothetical protein [Cyanobacteriota bacterium]
MDEVETTDDGKWHSLPLTGHSAERLTCELYRLARGWLDRSDKSSAEKLLRMILSIDDEGKGLGTEATVKASLDLAHIMEQTDRYLEAEQYFLRAINRCMHSLTEEHYLFSTALKSYANLLRMMKCDCDAEALEARVRNIEARMEACSSGDSTFGAARMPLESDSLGSATVT